MNDEVWYCDWGVTPAEAQQLGAFVKQRRQALGLSFEELLYRVHIEKEDLQPIEDGLLRDIGRPELLRGIAFALKVGPVDLYELIGRDWQLQR